MFSSRLFTDLYSFSVLKNLTTIFNDELELTDHITTLLAHETQDVVFHRLLAV